MQFVEEMSRFSEDRPKIIYDLLLPSMKADLKKILKGHAASVYCLYFDEVAPLLFSGSSDRMVGSWNPDELMPGAFSVKLEAPVFSLLKLDQLLLIGQGNGGVHVVDMLTKKEIRHLKFHNRPVFEMVAHPLKPYLYFLGGEGTLSIVDSSNFSLKWSLPIAEDKLRTATLDLGGSNLFVGSSDGFIRILETDYYNTLDEVKAHEGGVYDMAWLSGEQMLSVGRDGHIRIWRYSEGRIEETEAVPAHHYAIYSIDISPTRKFFATASRDKTVKVWNPLNLKKPLRISRKGPVGHTHSVNVVKWINDQLLVSAGDDRDLHFWSISSS